MRAKNASGVFSTSIDSLPQDCQTSKFLHSALSHSLSGGAMIRQVLLAALAGGVIVFVFTAIQNTVVRGGEPRELPDQAALLPALQAAIPSAGFYFFPGGTITPGMTKQEKAAAQADHEVRFREGPTGVLVYRRGGEDFQFGRRLAVQFLLGFLAALVAATILGITASATTYSLRTLLVLL